MDQTTWLWRKRSSEKTIVSNGDEIQSVPNEKELDIESSLKSLNEKLASVLDECSAKDKLVQDCEKRAENAISDKLKAEEEVRRLKDELDEVHKQKVAANERLGHLNSALKNCMEQLKMSNEFEKAHKKLEQKLSETSKNLASLTAENSYLTRALLVKEKLIEDLNNAKRQKEAEFEALMMRLDSTEKENAFLRYEFRTLEKELDHRHEEMECGRRSLEASYKQNLENVKKIKKLEVECQRLRVLTRKRFPAPAALASIKSDIEVQGRNQINTRRKALIDQMRDLENENKILKECLAKKEDEILYHRKVKNFSDQLSFASSRSWTTALVSENEHDKFTDGPQTEPECKTIGASSEMSLMDDFVEMEKLAIVAVDASLSDSSKETKRNDWVRDVSSIISEQHNITKRTFDEILGDIKMTLEGNVRPKPSELLPISGYITWKSPTSSPRSSLLQDSSDEFSRCDVNRSIGKIIELVRRFDVSRSEDRNTEGEKSSKVSDYKIHVFGWKSRELTTVVQEFVDSCRNLLDGKIKFEKFTWDLASIFGWIIENCISYQDHSTVRDEFQKHLSGDGPGTAFELESVQNLLIEMEKMYSAFQVEIEGLKNELSFIKSSDESQQSIVSLQNEMGILKESKRTTEDQIENLKTINVDLDTQLTVIRAKLNDVLKKLSSVEVELDDKSHCCEELEGTCLELQLQLASITSNQTSEENENQEELLQTGLEITKASVKLAECEQTIMKLGMQLKALGSAKELSVVDKVLSITDTENKKFKQRSSLRDQMICEDNVESNNLLQSPKTKEVISTTNANAPSVSCNNVFSFPACQVATPNAYGNKNANIGALVIVPSKKRIGFLRKLLLRRKKHSSKNIYFGK